MITAPNMSSSPARQKKPYHRPKIVKFGSIHALPHASAPTRDAAAEGVVESDDSSLSHPSEALALLAH
jgi:hypothetical protein